MNLNEIIELGECCNKPDIIGDGEVVCRNCGYVYEREIISQTRRAYTNEDKKERSNNTDPISYTEMGNKEEFDNATKNYKFDSRQLFRMKKWDGRFRFSRFLFDRFGQTIGPACAFNNGQPN